MRRLPIYLLLDTSESMRGEPLDAVRMGVELLVSDLRQDPMAMESVWLSVITFGGTVKQIVPLTDLTLFQMSYLEASGACLLGGALEELLNCSDRELVARSISNKGDYKPIVFLMANGRPTDGWEPAADKLKKKGWTVVACTAGHDLNMPLLKRITETVVKLDQCQPRLLGLFVTRSWIDLFDDGPCPPSAPLTDNPALPPPPPPDIKIVTSDTCAPQPPQPIKQIQKAVLADGREVEYVVERGKVMEGGMMKQVFFTPDKSAVLCFFNDKYDSTWRARLDAVVGKFNPTIGRNGEYWKTLFCWPTAIIQSPRMGFTCPTYPSNFFFKEGPWKGKDKEMTWFLGKTGGGKPFRDLLPESERGPWINYIRASLLLARAVRKLHSSGLAYSDLSPRTILLDYASGQCLLISWDLLVVPGIFPPEVMGTPGYIAPEVLATQRLPLKDPQRKYPCVSTDQFALAVLIYQILLLRHPLKGPKLNSIKSAEEDDLLSMGANALFIEHPTDRSNRPPDKDLKPTYEALGLHLVALFNQAFVEGLHAPNRRPLAAQWEDALLKTWDLLHPCAHPACTHKWFVVWQKGEQACPFCGTKVAGTVLKLNFRKEARPGTWLSDGELVVYNGNPIMKWHVFDNVFPNETLTDAERGEVLADCQLYNGKWLLINRKLGHMVSPGGNPIPPNSAIELKPEAQFRLSTEPHGRIAEVELIQQGDE